MLPYPKTQQKTHNLHKEVVSAQGLSVGATVGIGRAFGALSASAPKIHKNNKQCRNTTQQYI